MDKCNEEEVVEKEKLGVCSAEQTPRGTETNDAKEPEVILGILSGETSCSERKMVSKLTGASDNLPSLNKAPIKTSGDIPDRSNVQTKEELELAETEMEELTTSREPSEFMVSSESNSSLNNVSPSHSAPLGQLNSGQIDADNASKGRTGNQSTDQHLDLTEIVLENSFSCEKTKETVKDHKENLVGHNITGFGGNINNAIIFDNRNNTVNVSQNDETVDQSLDGRLLNRDENDFNEETREPNQSSTNSAQDQKEELKQSDESSGDRDVALADESDLSYDEDDEELESANEGDDEDDDQAEDESKPCTFPDEEGVYFRDDIKVEVRLFEPDYERPPGKSAEELRILKDLDTDDSDADAFPEDETDTEITPEVLDEYAREMSMLIPILEELEKRMESLSLSMSSESSLKPKMNEVAEGLDNINTLSPDEVGHLFDVYQSLIKDFDSIDDQYQAVSQEHGERITPYMMTFKKQYRIIRKFRPDLREWRCGINNRILKLRDSLTKFKRELIQLVSTIEEDFEKEYFQASVPGIIPRPRSNGENSKFPRVTFIAQELRSECSVQGQDESSQDGLKLTKSICDPQTNLIITEDKASRKESSCDIDFIKYPRQDSLPDDLELHTSSSVPDIDLESHPGDIRFSEDEKCINERIPTIVEESWNVQDTSLDYLDSPKASSVPKIMNETFTFNTSPIPDGLCQSDLELSIHPGTSEYLPNRFDFGRCGEYCVKDPHSPPVTNSAQDHPKNPEPWETVYKIHVLKGKKKKKALHYSWIRPGSKKHLIGGIEAVELLLQHHFGLEFRQEVPALSHDPVVYSLYLPEEYLLKRTSEERQIFFNLLLESGFRPETEPLVPLLLKDLDKKAKKHGGCFGFFRNLFRRSRT